MADLSELYGIVRAALVGDSTLTAMLGSAGAVYQERPETGAVFPAISMRIRHTNPITELTGTGAYKPVWELKLYGTNADALRAIQMRLWALLDIPRIAPAGLANANWKITSLCEIDSFDGPDFSMANDLQAIQTLVTIWNSLVLPVQ